MISLLPIQELMSLISVQGKLRASAPCSIFYVDSFHTAWILHQVPLKLLCPSICIELMVALAPTIPRVSPLLSLIFISALSVPSFDVVMVAPPLDLTMHPPNALPYARSCDDSSSLARSIELCGVVVLRYSSSTCVVHFT
ncbi:hypothetical protein B296_00009937 [Ensete ventricosum]|uniref:Uncharacterized protein n=1 Tax=Ensete ventricosum TaxID=4639 RepID=A0A427AHI1_ENSVE|nr:hypothetical protein B296_00009937 [Ensete ventricosum]